jgi:hypothetical protein
MATGSVMMPSIRKSQRQPLRPCRLSMEEFIPVWMKPPIMVPARPEAVKIPERLPSSVEVYQEPRTEI